MNQGPPRGPPGHPGAPGELRGAPPRGADWNRPPGMLKKEFMKLVFTLLGQTI